MNSEKVFRPFPPSRAFLTIALAAILVFFVFPAFAQTQQGDKPVKNQRKVREARFKSRSRQGDKARVHDVAGRRIRTKNSSSAGRAATVYPVPKSAKAARNRDDGKSRAGKPISPLFSSGPRDTQRAWKGGPYGARIRPRPGAARNQNVFGNRSQLALLKRMQQPPGDGDGGKKKVVPRSASRAYLSRKSVNPMARFIRKSKQGESAYLTDPAGRKVRGRNFQTPRQPVIQAGDVYHGRKRVGDRPYKGREGGYLSATQKKPKAWTGDITGRRIRGRNHQSKIQTGGGIDGRNPAIKPVFGDRQRHAQRKGQGHLSATRSGEERPGKRPPPVRAPGVGAHGIGGLVVRTRSARPNAEAARAGDFQGNVKPNRAGYRKAGGSRSGERWNNNGQPIQGTPPADEGRRAAMFQGNIKGGKPLAPKRAGGSRSGKFWNNDGTPLTGTPPSDAARRTAAFQGNVKGGRPLTPKRAGESRSGKLWNNNETPLTGNPPTAQSRRAAMFQGNIKGGGPDKPKNAGESRSGVLWNNDEKPIKTVPPSLEQLASYRYRGDIRMSRFKRNYIRNPNAADAALKKARPDESTYDVHDIPKQTKVRQYNYVRNPSSDERALKVREPGKAFARATEYQGNIKMKKYDWLAKNDFHPDAKFIKINRNNVDDEKDALTGFRLWWAKTFKKNDTQPDHLKEKVRKPRYDKGEQGLWYE